MAIHFQRQIVVDIAGIRIEEPRVMFTVSNKRDSEQQTGEVSIYNLKRATHRTIEERGTDITIDAGYKQGAGLARVFEGVAQRIWKHRDENSFVTKIQLGDILRSKSSRGGALERTFEGEQAIREIVPPLVKAMGEGVELGPLDAIPPQAAVTNFTASGRPGDSLQSLLDTIQGKRIRWYTDGNQIRFAEGSKKQTDKLRVTKTPTTGIVNVPELQEDGRAKIETLLDPRLQVGGEIVVKGSDYISDTPYSIMGVVHQGDNWTGRFVTLVDAVHPDFEEQEQQEQQ